MIFFGMLYFPRSERIKNLDNALRFHKIRNLRLYDFFLTDNVNY